MNEDLNNFKNELLKNMFKKPTEKDRKTARKIGIISLTIWVLVICFVVAYSLIKDDREANKDDNSATEYVDTGVSDRTEEIRSLLDVNTGEVFENYQAACASKDFMAAHKILAEMKNKVEEMRQSMFTPKKKRMAAESELEDATKYVQSEESKWIFGMIETACEDQDFEKAHILNRELKKRCDVDNTKYVVLKEAKFLASMDNEESAQRILYLINDIENESERSDVAKQIFDLAKTIGNDYLKNALEKMVKDD